MAIKPKTYKLHSPKPTTTIVHFPTITGAFVVSAVKSEPATTSPGFDIKNNRERVAVNMNTIARHASSFLRWTSQTLEPLNNGHHQLQQLQQSRGIRVRVINGNVEQALTLLQRKMTASGIERMIKREQRFHIKNSEKRVLAKKNLERRLKSEDLARKLKAILSKKIRGM
ncbi:hypothetical protein PIB30_027488 [Stylosanthes scabra]|uniref:Ribosomal protein S21 n=1 Tax=Stylosanthes scabra TaxID=79078 RepID=A0ABU6QA56_9FABA|nr:hypothetical protein [Stylosanthes scabra]